MLPINQILTRRNRVYGRIQESFVIFKRLFHVPVLRNESIEHLQATAGGVFLDCTFGCGGHTQAILDANPHNTVYTLDRDPTAVELAHSMARSKYPDRLFPVHGRFGELASLLPSQKTFDGILFDFGCSSVQLDTPVRGFSFQTDGPLDMRMDHSTIKDDIPCVKHLSNSQLISLHLDHLRENKVSAADVVNTYEPAELASLFRDYGDERHASKIAKAIVKVRETQLISTTTELVNIIKNAVPAKYLYEKIHPATRTFQALRIHVNQELNEIQNGLSQALSRLHANGTIVAISFHSGEDGIVKRFFNKVALSEKRKKTTQFSRFDPLVMDECKRLMSKKLYGGHDAHESDQDPNGNSSSPKEVYLLPVGSNCITPTLEERQANPRARSAKMRVLRKVK
eukprot:Sdes_comp20422_c0_seq1m14487